MKNIPFTKIKKSLILLLTIMAAATCFGQNQFERAEFLKSPAPGQKKGEAVKGTLNFDTNRKAILFLDKHGAESLDIKYDSVKNLLYERTAKPRYTEGLLIAWPLMFTKSKKHYLTLQYEEPAGTGHYAIVHLDKSNYQEILATIEAQTGKRVERTEEH
jgi:hypothetical protein